MVGASSGPLNWSAAAFHCYLLPGFRLHEVAGKLMKTGHLELRKRVKDCRSD